ncbi:hypothetical protein CC86DRAFT_372107 [Ophiobolus disseminans]|uniref:Uncharacterized protein n=1 Tax=Ophiobolus disseminans TaxID=1469910 RepID=A0A6A6ZSA4_9PLEO|nr:hypothetical protein CC86DRAFT_372107 [Ophiobolus disseminans]
MTEDRKYDFASPSPTETLPAYSTTWGNDIAREKPRKSWNWWKLRYGWNSACRPIAQRSKSACDAAWRFMCARGWPFLRALTPSLRQVLAFLLVLVFGVAPMAFLGYYTPIGQSSPGNRPFYGVFQDKVLSCGDSFGTPENSTISGIEKFFVLDKTFGRFSFAEVKSLDVAWDILVGRGVQMIAWWVGYVVFSDALLRAIERHPTSFQIFQRIALEGPSLLSLWTLVKELWCSRSKRTKALFFYMWMATFYIMCIPMFLGAMTGYDSTSIAWVSLDDDNNIVTAESIERSGVVMGTPDKTFDEPICADEDSSYRAYNEKIMRRNDCNCQLRNGTILSPNEYSTWMLHHYSRAYLNDCRFDYPGVNKTFERDTWSSSSQSRVPVLQQCGASFNMTVDGKSYDALSLNITTGFCYGGRGYEFMYLYDKTRCLPDTANPTYKWGFSTMLSGMFVFVHFGWALTMYILWQDAQFRSTLVKGGYQMTPLRAAFAMAKAAKRKTGMSEKQLVRANTNELEQELYGTRRTKGTKVEYGIFEEGDEEHGEVEVVRRKNLGPKLDLGVSETSISSAISSKTTTPSTPV